MLRDLSTRFIFKKENKNTYIMRGGHILKPWNTELLIRALVSTAKMEKG